MFIAGSMAGEEGVAAARKISIDAPAPEDAPGQHRVAGEEVTGVPVGIRDPVAAAQGQPERREMVGVPVMGPQSRQGTGAGPEPAEGTYERFMSRVVAPGMPGAPAPG